MMADDDDARSLLKLLDPESINVVLARHGQAGGNGVIEGWTGSALSDRGMEQAEHLGRRLGALPLEHIYCSDLARSWQTAQAVRRYHPEVPFVVTPDVREICACQVRGRPIARTLAERQRLHEERERVERFAGELRRRHTAGQLVAVIGHNGLNGMLIAALSGLGYRQAVPFVSNHTGVALVNVGLLDGQVALRLMGCTRHLPHELVTHMNVPSAPADAGTTPP